MPERSEKADNKVSIPSEERSDIKDSIRAYSSELCKNHDDLIGFEVRFSTSFCYIRIYQEPSGPVRSCNRKIPETEEIREKLRNTPSPLCRLTYLSHGKWTLFLYNFCKDRYEPSLFLTGLMEGTPIEGLETAMEYFYGIHPCKK